jgi:threonine aldolase
MGIADFRSDTLTAPGAAMREAMASAVVGDDVFGEDPTVNELEREAARFLGQEAALFVPSGTMANQIATHVHCRPGDELICEERSHIYLYEGGGISRWSGTSLRLLRAEGGFPDPSEIRAAARPDDPHRPRSRLLVLENTHNMAGGRVLDAAGMRVRVAAARDLGLAVHVDGARLANAAVASNCTASELVAGVDSVSLCFSKGLGAPVGSVLAGGEAFIREARRVRKALGGGMRQAGILAAAALMALRDGPARLAVDHSRARKVAQALVQLPSVSLDLDAVESNIVMVGLLDQTPENLLGYLEARKIRAMSFGPTSIRLVFHCDLTDDDVDRCIEQITAWATR